MTVTGTIKYQPVGVGTWTIVSNQGVTYELYKPPAQIKQNDLKVKIEGKIKKDIMTIAMVGDVLEIDSYQVID